MSSRSVLSKTRGAPQKRCRNISLSTIPETKEKPDESDRSDRSDRPANSAKSDKSKTSTALPPWDRVCDVGFQQQTANAKLEDKFTQSVAFLYAQYGRVYKPDDRRQPDVRRHKRQAQHHPSIALRLTSLPVPVRLQIYRHVWGRPGTPVMAADSSTALSSSSSSARPIRLNPMVYNRLAWPESAFDALEDVLEPLQGALAASFALRAELLAALFLERTFHLTFSPYVRPSTCPLALSFVARYGCLMQHVILELDCTRLGYGCDAAAARLGPGTLHMDGLVRDFVAAQQTRRLVKEDEARHGMELGLAPMDSLVVLCRRFYGSRPQPDSVLSSQACSPVDGQGETPYVGPEHEKVAWQLASLGGLASSVRLAGFSPDFSTRLLRRLSCPQDSTTPAPPSTWYKKTPSDAYPLPPDQSAYLDLGQLRGAQLSSGTDPDSNNDSIHNDRINSIDSSPTGTDDESPSELSMSELSKTYSSSSSSSLTLTLSPSSPPSISLSLTPTSSSSSLALPSSGGRRSFSFARLDRSGLEQKHVASMVLRGLQSVVLMTPPKKLRKRRPFSII